MANLSSGGGSGGGDDGSSYYDPRRDPEYEYTPDEQEPDDDDSGGGSTGTRGGTRDDDSGGSSGGGGTSGGSTSDDDDSSSSGGSSSSESSGLNDNRSSAEQNFDRLDDSDATDDTGTDGPQIPDDVDEQTQRNLRDITDETASSTPSEAQGAGQEVFGEGFVVEGQQMSQDEAEQFAETQLVDQNDQFGSTSQIEATVTESGEVTYTTTDRVVVGKEAGRDLYIPAGTTVGGGSIPTTQEAAQALEERAIAETPAQDETDVTVDVGDSGLEAELTVSGREQAVAEELGVGIEDIAVEGGTVVPTTGEGESALREPAQRSSAGQNFARLEDETRTTTGQQPTEEFGDVAVQIPGTNRFVEESLERGSDAVQTVADTAGGLAGGGYGDFLGQQLRGEDADVRAAVESGREDQTRAAGAFDDFVTGAISIADVPGVAVTAKEAGEYAGYAGSEVIAGNYDDLVSDTGTAGRQRVGAVADYARANPAEVAGLGAGGLFGSAAIMGTAGRISSRAGTVSRYAIQPGEEIAGSAGFRATRRLAGEDTAQRAFPNREPLIFSEEAAISGARNVRSRIGELEYQSASRRFDSDSPFTYTNAETRFEGDEWPAEYTPARFRLGRTRGGADGPQTVQQPERLGGAGQDVVDRMYAVEADTQPTAGGENVPGIRDRIEGQVREFAAAERGQQQLIGRQRSRTETESEVQQTADRVSPNLYQQSVTRQLDAEYEARMGTIEEPDVTGRLGFESELETRRAGRTEVRTETRTDRGIGTEIGTRVQPGFEIGQRPGSDVFTGAEFDVGQEPRFDVFADTAEMTGFDTEFDQEFETEVETEQETEQEFELFREVETETETEFEFETETRRELEGLPDLERAGSGFAPGAFEGARGDIFTGFRNPLTGEEL